MELNNVVMMNLIDSCDTFGNWLKNAMYTTDTSAKSLAFRLKNSVNTVYVWMRGQARPASYSQVKDICRCLGCDFNPVWTKYFG